MEHHSPNITYVNESDISVQAAKDHYEDPTVRVERTHTFSNGETFHYATSGKDVMSGDMILGTVKQLKRDIKAYEKQLKSGGVEAELEAQGAIRNRYCKRKFIFCFAYGGKKWDGGVINYEPISTSLFTSNERAQINAAMGYIERVTNRELTFVERTSGDRVYFANDNNQGCRSFVGRMGGRQRINLEDDANCFDKPNSFGFDGSIAHELLHAVGFMHEHQRKDRNEFVRVNSNESNYNPTYDAVIRTGYDFGSIMHYFLSSRLVRINFEQDFPTAEVGQRDRLSDLDVLTIKAHY